MKINWADYERTQYDELKSIARKEIEKHRNEYDPARIDQLLTHFAKMNDMFTHANPYTRTNY